MTPEDILTRALASQKGIKYSCGDERRATAERFRLYRFIAKDREANEKAGQGLVSEFDRLELRVEKDFIIIRHPLDPEVIEL